MGDGTVRARLEAAMCRMETLEVMPGSMPALEAAMRDLIAAREAVGDLRTFALHVPMPGKTRLVEEIRVNL